MLGRRLLTVTKATQQACRGMAMKAEVTPAVRRKNIAVAITIVCFVGGVYYHSINKMKQDEFDTLVQEDLAEHKNKA